MQSKRETAKRCEESKLVRDLLHEVRFAPRLTHRLCGVRAAVQALMWRFTRTWALSFHLGAIRLA